MRTTYIVHVEGSTPHAIDHWTKPYRSLGVAAGQATRWVFSKHWPRDERTGDFTARIYRLSLDARPGGQLAPELMLVQVVS